MVRRGWAGQVRSVRVGLAWPVVLVGSGLACREGGEWSGVACRRGVLRTRAVSRHALARRGLSGQARPGSACRIGEDRLDRGSRLGWTGLAWHVGVRWLGKCVERLGKRWHVGTERSGWACRRGRAWLVTVVTWAGRAGPVGLARSGVACPQGWSGSAGYVRSGGVRYVSRVGVVCQEGPVGRGVSAR